MNRRASFPFPLLLLIALALCTGCLDFTRETVTYRYDAKADTLRIFLVYHGIFGADGGADLSEREQSQLAEVLTGDRAFFFTNWILEYNRATIKKELERLNDPDEIAGKPAAIIAKQKKLYDLLLAHVRVDNGPFFYDADRRLCGAQRLTVQKISVLLRAANELIREELLRRGAASPDLEEGERQAALKALAKEGDFLRLTGNRFSLRWPITGDDFEKSFGQDADKPTKTLLAEFNRQGGHLAWEKGELFAHIGGTNSTPVTLALPVSQKPYTPNAVAAIALRAQLTVLGKFDAPAAAKVFIETGKGP
jgi:hypothetical protein